MDIPGWKALEEYCQKFLKQLIRTQELDDPAKRIIALPKPFMVPNLDRFNYLFYWDSYFMAQPLLKTNPKLIEGILEDFVYLLNRFKIIPNISSFDFLDRSQPPVFASLVWDLYQATTNLKTLKNFLPSVIKEYETVWTNSDDLSYKIGTYHHRKPGTSLSCYGDRDAGYHLNAECESGFDFTCRFASRCNDFLPVDLNAGWLYQAETVLIEGNRLLGLITQNWEEKQTERRREVNNKLWNNEQGFFFDFDTKLNQQSSYYSLAGFMPMWSGLATPEQAQKMVKHLAKFETDYGLTISSKDSLPNQITLINLREPWQLTVDELLASKQWDYPNLWHPLEYLVIVGLIRYGYTQEAARLLHKSIRAEIAIFKRYGTVYEKFDGTTGKPSLDFHYPNQEGFGWTCALLLSYQRLLTKLYKS